ncbi:MAG: hypothetical protein H6605_01315 [Flavobacteriales bacterium]|nr:hypothetical protein [Flavobacteriales bacterium]
MLYPSRKFYFLNAFLIVIIQILAAYFLGFSNRLGDVFDPEHLSIYLITFMISILSFEVSYLMKALYGSDSIRTFNGFLLFVPVLFASAILLFAFTINSELFWLSIKALIILVASSILTKRSFVISSFLNSILLGLTLYYLSKMDPNMKQSLAVIFSVFILGMNFIRLLLTRFDRTEMSYPEKNSHQIRLNTIRWIAIAFIFLFILILTTGVRLILLRYFTPPLSYVFITYLVLCIGIPLFYIMSILQLPEKDHGYRNLHKVALYAFVSLILSMLFF